jgi:hypothetical protein
MAFDRNVKCGLTVRDQGTRYGINALVRSHRQRTTVDSAVEK